MDWWTSLAASIALLWLLCFIDGHAVLELRLLFHALTKAACHLYLALLPLRRAASHFGDSVRYLVNHAQHQHQHQHPHQQPPPPLSLSQGYSQHDHHQHQHHHPPPARKGTLHFIEAMCVVCETVPNLMCAGAQGGFYVLAATLRVIQANLFSQVNGEKERWDKERHRAKESEKKMNSKVLEYISVFCQDPVTALRIKVDVPPVYR
ncbi:hypothetical protein N1851_019407 [Merluccius polli]|uniref:Uncharacterized protein n=1 Tax=Merluccius polli TaxID=89951 RepID=A0AA47MMA6_MERPO|nr:hypothetical protein N1851_019407 [Merluccius polli]